MPFVVERLARVLSDLGVAHEVLEHDRDYTAQRTAHDTHTRGRAFAKTVVLEVGGAPVMLVLPASERLSIAKVRRRFGTQDVRLASETTLARLFPDCEVGAEPPFGNLYGLPVHAAPELAENTQITFNAGRHDTAIRMAWRDYARLAQPMLAEVAVPAQARSGSFSPVPPPERAGTEACHEDHRCMH